MITFNVSLAIQVESSLSRVRVCELLKEFLDDLIEGIDSGGSLANALIDAGDELDEGPIVDFGQVELATQ